MLFDIHKAVSCTQRSNSKVSAFYTLTVIDTLSDFLLFTLDSWHLRPFRP